MKAQTYFLILISFPFLQCSKHEIAGNNNNDPENPYGVVIEDTFEHIAHPFYQSSCKIGLWMLKEGHIANWKGVYDFELYEAINVLWIDYIATSHEEAKLHIKLFLENSGFSTRGFSSSGYHTFIDDKEVVQYPLDDPWSDHKNPFVENNHGRVFISGNINTGNHQQVYYSSGSFSRETSMDHYFISFNQSRDKLTLSANWVEEGKVVLKNVYNKCKELKIRKEMGYAYSTIDHDGSRVFVLYPE